MISTLISLSRFIALAFLIVVTGLHSSAQQTLTKITAWNLNAYVHLPDDYKQTGRQTYPVIIFLPGIGEATGSPKQLLSYGPSKFIEDGFKMEFDINGTIEKPIVISVQPGKWPTTDAVNDIITDILATYKVDLNRVYLTGLSMGGGAIDAYAITNPDYAQKITAIVAMHAVEAPPSLMGKVYAGNGGKWWGIEGKDDLRDMETIAKEMNSVVPGSAVYTLISSGAGTSHCCWNTFYDPSWTRDGDNIYTWLLKQTRASGRPAPVSSSDATSWAGSEIVLPVNLLSFKAVLQDSKVKVTWQTGTEISNSHFTIEKSTNGADFTPVATVRGKGTYVFTADYSFVDETPAEGVNYYRLKQYDFNGNVKDLGTKTVSVKGTQKTWSAYPTHITQNTFTLNAGTAANIGQTYQLVDISGRVLLTGKIAQLTKTIEVPNLQKGLFILRAGDGKLVKLIKD